MTAQEQVAEALKARGYDRENATLLFLQVVYKVIEETCEMGEKALLGDWPMIDLIRDLGRLSKVRFDSIVHEVPEKENIYIPTEQIRRVLNEMADVQVTLFHLAATLERILGKRVDVVQEAVNKATADIKRGVRK